MTQPTRCSKRLSKSTKKSRISLSWPSTSVKRLAFPGQRARKQLHIQGCSIVCSGFKRSLNCLSSQILSAAATTSCHKGPFPRPQIGAASKRKALTWVRGLAFAACLQFFSRRRGVISLHHHQSKEKAHNWLATWTSTTQCFYIRVQQTRSPGLCHQLLVYD